MFFNNVDRYKENYLIIKVGPMFQKKYDFYQYEIFDELKNLHDQNGHVTDEDIRAAIRHFRETIAKSVFSSVEREYRDTEEHALELLNGLYLDNHDNIQEKGPTIACIYSILIKLIKGEEYEVGDDEKFKELVIAMVDKLQEYENETINSSLDILREDGIISGGGEE